MTRDQLDNAINEAMLKIDDAEKLWRSKGFSEAAIRAGVEHATQQVQYNYCRYLKEENDMRINEAVLALDDAEDAMRLAGMSEASISSIYDHLYSQIQENAARSAIRFAPVREDFSDSVFAGAGSAGVTNVNKAGLDNFPRLGNPDSLTYDPSLYSQSVAIGNEPIMGVKESGIPSIINKDVLAKMAFNEIYGYNAPEPKPSPELQMEQFMSKILA